MTSAESLLALLQTARGERPYSLQNEEAEQVLNIALAMLVELAVSNERIDRLERTVAALKGASLQDYRAEVLPPDVEVERQAATDALMVRALRVLIDPREPTDGRAAAVAQAGMRKD